MKKIKNSQIKFLVSLLIVTLLFIGINNYAYSRKVAGLNMYIIGHNTKRTEYLVKSKYSRHVVQIDGPRNGIRVRHMLLNSNGDWRNVDGWKLTGQGWRDLIQNTAKPGYKYAIELTREFSYDGGFNITGSWSPDTRNGEN